MDILAPCKAIWTFWHRHFGTCATVPKCPCAEMSLCQNVPVPNLPHAEKSSCRKVPMSKCSHVEMSICRNVCSAKWCTCRNVPVMKHPCGNDSCQNVPCRNGLSALVQLVPDSQLRWHYLRTKSDVEAGVLGCSGISSSFSCK